jgi:hypothetical protein
MSFRRIALTLATTGLLALAFAPAASAKIAIIGSALNLPYEGGVSTTAGTTSVQLSQAGGDQPFPLISPANGVITEWKVRTGDDAAIYTLRVLTPTGTNTFSASGSVGGTTVPAGTVDTIFTYPGNSVPIKEGDYIALRQDGVPDEGIAQNTTSGVPANVFANRFAADGNFADGTSVAFLPDAQHELLLQATISYCEVPKLKGKTEKKARKALKANDCGVKVKEKDVEDKKDEGEVLSQKQKKGFTAAPGTKIKITVGD